MHRRSKSVLHVLFLLALIVSVLGSAMVFSPAHAAGIVVNTNSDVSPADDGVCTLREAITAANGDTASGLTAGECAAGSGADVISFAAPYTILIASTLPAVTTTVTITGNGAANTVIEAAAAGDPHAIYPVLTVSVGGNLVVDMLTVANGGNCYTSCIGGGGGGGGINNAGTLTVTNSVLSGNAASTSYRGGAIYNSGSVTLEESTLSNNIAGVGGGAIENVGTLHVTNSTFTGNHSNFSDGGAIDNRGGSATADVTGSTFSGNFASGGGSGLQNLFGGTVTIANSTFTNNNAVDDTIQIVASGPATTTTIINSTIAGNAGSFGILNSGSGAMLNMSNTIVSGTAGGTDCFNSGGTVGTSLNNLIQTNAAGVNACGTPTLTADPMLGPLADNGGPTQTMTLQLGSPAIDAGDPGTCSSAPVNAVDQRGVSRPQDGNGDGTVVCDIGATESRYVKAKLISAGAYDGLVLESSETSGKGGTANAKAPTFNLGDDALNKQFRSVLSFNTAMPNNASILSVTLKIRKAGLVGSNPFGTLGKIQVDVKTGAFSNKNALQIADFQAVASKGAAMAIGSRSVLGWYSKALSAASFGLINKTGVTQMRLRFAADDNNNLTADYLMFYSGNATTAANRPQLLVTYYAP